MRLGEGGDDVAVLFANPPSAERLRRAGDRSAPLWWFDAERLCVVVWLFDVPASTATELTLRFDGRAVKVAQAVLAPRLGPSDQASVATSAGALLLMRRAQAAKALLDGTYPETQPQDYGRATWLAGLGSRLASRPHNFSRELTALPATLDEARHQLQGECARRVSAGSGGKERVRNATALVMETGASEVA